ncbi:MAG: hypothetical protein IS860_01395, partial [Nitrosopumilus sp.]|nr:hypothetical protein [Nitrosopumilus sp.]
MSTKIGVFAVVSLSLVMLTPSYADVTSFSLHEKSFFTIDETFSFSGKQEGKDIVYVIIRDSSGNFKGMLSDPAPGQGEFSVIPRPVENFFASQGTYNATAFTDKQKEGDGVTIELEFDGDKVFQAPDVILKLKTIDNKEVEVEKTITFTVKLVDDSIKDPVFSLKNEPSGATIDSKTGKFVWTPSKSHGSIQDVHYGFDIIVKKGSQEDTEEVIITVKKAYVEPEETEPKDTEPEETEPKDTEPEETEPKETEPEETEPKDTEPEELGIAPFVDESKDPQSYVDRYNNEA